MGSRQTAGFQRGLGEALHVGHCHLHCLRAADITQAHRGSTVWHYAAAKVNSYH